MLFSLVVPLILCSFISLWLILKVIWHKKTCKYSAIYCPSNVPVFGSALSLESDSHKLHNQHREFAKRGGHIYITWMGWEPLIWSEKPEHAKIILGSQINLQKSFAYNFFHEWLNTGLLTSYGAKWKQRRRLITPSFHYSILNEFIPIFEKKAQSLVKKFSAAARDRKIIDVQIPAGLTTLEAMCETSLSNSNSNDKNDTDYVKAVQGLGHLLRYRMFRPWLWPYCIYVLTSYGKKFYQALSYVREYTVNAINKRIAVRKKLDDEDEEVENKDKKEQCIIKTKQNVCLIDTLINSYLQGDIDVDGIREEVDTLVFEGHDTTASGISFCLYMAGLHKEYQNILHDEITKTNGENIMDIINKLEFLDCFIKESMRLYPPVAAIGRRIEKDVSFEEQRIHKGTNVAISIFGIHRNENHWKNPLQFNPDRFIGDNYLKRDPYCYIPFSAGPRNCVGQRFALLELKICLYYILKNFNLTSMQTENELEICTDIVTRSRNGVLIKFEELKF